MNYFDKTYLCFITSDGDREAKDIFDEISDFLDSLDNDDDVQNIFTNLKIGSN